MALKNGKQSQEHVPIPTFGDWKAAENIPITEVFEIRRKNKLNSSDQKYSIKNFEAPVKEGTPAVPTGTGSKPEAKKDGWPAVKDGADVNQTDMHGHNESSARKHPRNLPHRPTDRPNSVDNQKIPKKTGGIQPSLQPVFPGKSSGKGEYNLDKRLPSDDKRRNPSDRFNGSPDRNVIVPPFPKPDEMDPSDAENYTGIFRIVGKNTPSRTPGTPYTQPNNPERGSSETKGCGCLRSLFSCFSSR